MTTTGPLDGWPANPIAAVTHPDPYPYYARLVAERPFYRDESLGLWVASSHAAVMAVMTDAACRVRPLSEPVPSAIAASPMADIFRHLVRMNDGAIHCPFKQAVTATLGSVDAIRLAAVAREQAATLAARHAPHRDRHGLTRFMFAFPIRVVARLLGVPDAHLDDVADGVQRYVGAVSPLADAAALAAGAHGARHLIDLFRHLLDDPRRMEGDGLLAIVARQFTAAGHGTIEPIIANGIGFMTQAYEATAALTGNTLLALADHAGARAAVQRDPALIDAAVAEVLLIDPPTHSTRRFLARDAVVAGQAMRAGDAVLVLLAAAGRDPAVNADGDRFNILRQDRRILNFGAGVHACPADRLASRIASVAVTYLLSLGVDLRGLRDSLSYMPSVAVRAPLFGGGGKG